MKRPLRLIYLFSIVIFIYIVSTNYRLIWDVSPLSFEYIHPKCNCVKRYPYKRMDLNTTCPSSSFRGPNQKVVSYSFYGPTNTSYIQGLSTNVEAAALLYPEWTVRVYHDIDFTDRDRLIDLCRAVCRYPNLDECYVGDMAHQYEGILKQFGMVWRFLVLGDPSVDIFVIRDLDSQIYQREVDAVNDWLTSKKTFHIMRDSPFHMTVILGGMWGAVNTKNRPKMQTIQNQLMLSDGMKIKSYDQSILAKYVWPLAQNDMLAHDSFLCSDYPGTSPWPTRRVNRTFVGDMPGLFITDECPEMCRPKNHQDWNYC